jgi:hypothetical protein
MTLDAPQIYYYRKADFHIKQGSMNESFAFNLTDAGTTTAYPLPLSIGKLVITQNGVSKVNPTVPVSGVGNNEYVFTGVDCDWGKGTYEYEMLIYPQTTPTEALKRLSGLIYLE